MQRKRASDFPQELIDLLNGYVHGGVTRRQFLRRAEKFAVGGVTATALFQMLRPNYAWAIQVPPDDKRIKSETVTVPSPQGNGSIKGYLVRPATADKLPAILVIHENRGLQPGHREDAAARRSRARQFHRLRAGWADLLGWLPGRRGKSRGAVRSARPRQADGRFPRLGRMAEIASGLHRQFLAPSASPTAEAWSISWR